MADQQSKVNRLTPNESKVLNYVEQHWFVEGEMPTPEQVSVATGVSPQAVAKALKQLPVVEELYHRGIDIDKADNLLSEEQLVGLSLFFDTKDGRSLKKKLADAGITTQRFEAWKQEPLFAQYMRQRAERAIGHNLAESEVALLDAAHRGDVSAIKLHLEIAGRWSSKQVSELNVEFFLMKIMEAIQRHVQTLPGGEQAVLNIAEELNGLITPTQAAAQQPIQRALPANGAVAGFTL